MARDPGADNILYTLHKFQGFSSLDGGATLPPLALQDGDQLIFFFFFFLKGGGCNIFQLGRTVCNNK